MVDTTTLAERQRARLGERPHPNEEAHGQPTLELAPHDWHAGNAQVYVAFDRWTGIGPRVHYGAFDWWQINWLTIASVACLARVIYWARRPLVRLVRKLDD